MIFDELRGLPRQNAELRKFGLLVGGVFALLAVWWWWRGKMGYAYWLIPAAPLLTLALVWPRALNGVYLAWMGLGFLLGWTVSTLLLTIFFYLVLTPMAFLARWMGKDFLDRRGHSERESFWIPRGRSNRPPRDRYEQQF